MQEQNALVTVKYVSEQVNVTREPNGDIAEGDPSAVVRITDIWTLRATYRRRILTGSWLRRSRTSRTRSMHAFARIVLTVALSAAIASLVRRWKKHQSRFQRQNSPRPFSALPDWQRDRHEGALTAFKLSCPKLLKGKLTGFGRHVVHPADWQPACLAANELSPSGVATTFFERWFVPYLVSAGGKTNGLFTGYFEADCVVHGFAAP